MVDLEEKIMQGGGSGGTGEMNHMRFVAREQDYLMNLRRREDLRQSALASSLYGSAGTFLSKKRSEGRHRRRVTRGRTHEEHA